MLLHESDRLREIWQNFRDDILGDWVQRQPCSRPATWWTHEAPAEPIPGCSGFHAGQRRRLGGVGTPQHEVISVWPRFEYGIPASWFDEVGASLFGGVPVNQDNPPVFESEATYLDRHGLLTPAELTHLAAHPQVLAPELVTFDDE